MLPAHNGGLVMHPCSAEVFRIFGAFVVLITKGWLVVGVMASCKSKLILEGF
jgi:hypothetical protein